LHPADGIPYDRYCKEHNGNKHHVDLAPRPMSSPADERPASPVPWARFAGYAAAALRMGSFRLPSPKRSSGFAQAGRISHFVAPDAALAAIRGPSSRTHGRMGPGSAPVALSGTTNGGVAFHGLVSPDSPLCPFVWACFAAQGKEDSPQRPQSTQSKDGCAQGARKESSVAFLCVLSVSVVHIPLFALSMGSFPRIRRSRPSAPFVWARSPEKGPAGLCGRFLSSVLCHPAPPPSLRRPVP